MNRQQGLDGLYFDYDALVDQQVYSKAFCKSNSIKFERDSLLSLDAESSLRQSTSKNSLVD